MIRRHQMAAQIEEICDGGVHADESLRLKHRFESPHPPFLHPRRLVGEFDPIVRVCEVSWLDSGMSSRRATV